MRKLYTIIQNSALSRVCASILFLLFFGADVFGQSDGLPRGAYQMPYTRYEANAAAIGGGATMLTPTFDQKKAESEASDQTCASLNANNSFVKWNLTAAGQGLVLRFSMPDNAGGTGQTGSLALFVGGTFVQNITLNSKWAWQYFSPNTGDGTKDPTNTPQSGWTARMRFDEVRVKLPSSAAVNTEIKLVKQNGDAINYYVDFIEVETIPAIVNPPAGYLNVTTYGAVADDAIDDKQAFVNAIGDARNQGKSIYVPAGRFLISGKLDLINISNITLQGAGMWQTELYFTNPSTGNGGIATGGTGNNIHMKDFYMNTENTIRTADYKGFVGGHGTNSSIERVWVEHFEVGFWAANFFGTPVTDGILVTNCRFRNNYADGVNFSRGTSNSICEHSNMRNNGDDAMASWSSNDGPQPCTNNEFRYCTAEHTWRAGGIGFFGGGGHRGHHLLIKDNVENGIRVNSDFPAVGNSFSTTLQMEVSETTVISCGTNANLWFNRYGAVDIFTRLYDVQNFRLRNVDINNSQKDAVMIYNVGTSFRITNLEFINVTINGAGKDGNINNYTAGTYDDYAGHGLFILPGTPGTNGSMSVTNLVMNNIPTTPALDNESPTTFTITTVGTVSVTGVSINPTTAVSIPQGGTSQLTAAISPSNATNQNVTWTSSNTAVATVSASGLVTAVTPGTANITVTTQDGNKTASKSVTVTAAVNIVATDATAGEGGDPGVFTISTSATSSNITVGYTISGTATSGDYSATPTLSGSVTLTTAAPSTTITINPIDDTNFEGSESLTLTVQPGAGYNLGGSTTATILIADNDSPACTAPVIGFTSTAPTIDQSIDGAWSNVPAGTINKVTLGAMPGDFAGSQWRAMYDATNLYVLVEVKDNAKFNDSGASWWEDDVVEIFIDGNNSKGTSYDGINDFQLGFRYNDANINLGGGSVTRTTGIVFAIQNVTGGYNLEAKIPWSTIGVTPAVGNQIGFEVEVDDDDNGGTRDSQVSAFATTSTAWSNPSVFGSVYLTTCGGTTVSVTGVTVSPTTATLNAGGTQQLTATVAPANATNKNVTWSTSNASVATVNTSGLVTAVANGSATITVTTQDGGKTATSAITVSNIAVTGVTVSPTTATLNAGGTQQLTATIAPANATNKNVTWSTSNASVATVNASGLVTAVANGSATITATTQDGSKTATSAITVSNIAVTGVTVSPTTATLNAGGTQQLTATIAPANATNKNVTWSTSNASVATVNASGLVTAVANGSATITVTTQDGSKTATSAITVSNIAVTGVTVSPTTATLNAGGTQQLTATVAPANATNKNVTWSTSNASVATVNASGLVSAIANGSATITVTTQDGSKTATSSITVSVPAGTVICYRNTSAVTVNGSLTEVSWSLNQTVSKTTVGTVNNTVTFGVLWDNTNLYIGAKILDANLFSDSPNTWDDDAIEVYIDANNNKLGNYDGLDNQIIKNYNKSTVFTKLAITGLQHAWASITGGYSVELAIPWSQLGISAPAQGTTIGFDLGYDDDDNAGVRDGQAVWNGNVNNYTSTTAFGSLVLNSSNSPAGRVASEEATISTENAVMYWPTIVENDLNIETDGSYQSIEVVDMLGRVHHQDSSIEGKTLLTVDLSNLTGGMHLVKLRGAQKANVFRIVKK